MPPYNQGRFSLSQQFPHRLTCCPQNETCTYGSIKTFLSPRSLEIPPMMPALMLGRPSARYSLMQILPQGLSAGTLLGSSRFLKDKLMFCLSPGVYGTQCWEIH